MPVLQARPVYDALLVALRTLNFPVGDADAPADTSDRYLTVWPITGGELDGSEGEPHEQGVLVAQVDWSAHSRDQCQWLADRGRVLLLGRAPSGAYVTPITVAGWVVSYRETRIVGQPENEGRDETGLTLFTARDQYELTVVPA